MSKETTDGGGLFLLRICITVILFATLWLWSCCVERDYPSMDVHEPARHSGRLGGTIGKQLQKLFGLQQPEKPVPPNLPSNFPANLPVKIKGRESESATSK